MPTYKNATNKDIITINYVFPPGKEVKTHEYICPSISGLELVSDEPSFNDVILSEFVVVSSSVDIPEEVNGKAVNNFSVTLSCISGEWEVRLNLSDNDPPLLISSGLMTSWSFRDRFVRRLWFELLSDTGKMLVTVRFL